MEENHKETMKALLAFLCSGLAEDAWCFKPYFEQPQDDLASPKVSAAKNNLGKFATCSAE
jgi:hypothetical protein